MSSIKNIKSLLKSLQKSGLDFKSFQLISSGEFDPEDVDWNFKDTLHPEFVHDLFSTIPLYQTDYSITSINTLKILFFHTKYIGFQFDSGPNEMTYLTKIGPFFIVVNTEFYKNGASKTDVITTYRVFSNKLFLTIFPFVKWAITKNYKNLMIDDMQMRKRKGELRKLGISFAKKNERYTFAETSKLNKKNCVYTLSIFNRSRSSKVLITKKDGTSVVEFLTGISDPWGLRGVIVNNKLALYPRMCDHEGACLDNAILNKNIMSCPWHGKKLKAIHEEIIIKNTKFIFNYNGKSFSFSFSINNKSIKLIVT